MPNDDIHKKLEKDKPPRVHIKYEVNDNGAIVRRELPFVMGVIGDFSGMPEKDLPPLKSRKFVQIDGENFDTVMAKMAPRVVLEAKDTLEKDKKQNLKVELKFSGIADFEPAKVAAQVPALKALLDARQRLSDLRSKMFSSERLTSELTKILNDTKELQKFEAAAKAIQDAEAEKDAEAEQAAEADGSSGPAQ